VTGGLHAELVGALGASLVAALGYLAAWFRRKTRVEAVRSGFVSHALLTDGLRRLARRVRAERTQLVRAHNGGHTPQPGRALYVSIVGEWVEGDLPFQAPEFQQAAVDGAYILDVLMPLVSAGEVRLTPAELHDGSMLADLYESNGVAEADVWLLGADPASQSLYFFAVQWTDSSARPDDATVRTELRATRERINDHLPMRIEPVSLLAGKSKP